MPETISPIRFATFELDPEVRELRKEGHRIELPERTFQVLEALLRRPGEIVTRDELRKLWPADAVSDFDRSLGQALDAIRRALGDSPYQPRFIEVLDGQGYRFVAPVEHGTKAIGRYQLLEKVGAGGMGVVYRARDTRLDRDVALKILPPGALGDEGARKRFRREALALSHLNHPNIATVYDFDTQGGVDFLVMEYIPGVTLDEKLSGGPLVEVELLRLGAQLAQGLAAAHHEGVVHRDLKPGNLRVTPDERIKIVDFGLAKLLRPVNEGKEPLATASASQPQGVMGTLPYMSPEQLQEKGEDQRSDIYGAGAVLYEMATGRRPFAEMRGARLIDAILHQPPPPPTALDPQVSPQLERIILKAMDKDPERRYQSAEELRADLERLSTPPMEEYVRPRPVRFRVLFAVAAGLVTVLSLAVVLNVGGLRDLLFAGARPASIHSLAVLPLENLSGDKEQEYFVDGMTDELITDLAKISSLRVISRTSVMQYKGTTKPLPQIARELHVDAVVEGTVRRSGDRVRITAQLIQAPTDRHLWAETYERDLKNVLALQGEVAWDIASKVQVKLTAQEHARLSGAPPVNPEAYEAYLKGRYYMVKWTSESTKLAMGYFDQAIEKDPRYALAYAGLAECYATGWASELGSERIAQAQTAATKALEIDDNLGEAHAALAVIKYLHAWDWPGAETEFRRALALSPNDPDAHHWYSHYLLTVGRIEDSYVESHRYLELDPLSPAANLHMGLHYFFARQYDQAMEMERKTLQMDPNYVEAHSLLGRAYEQKRMYPEALAEIERAVALSRESGQSERYLALLAQLYAAMGQTSRARELLEALSGASAHNPNLPAGVALIYASLGDKQLAVEWLKKAYEQHEDPLPFLLEADPGFDALRPDPRFQELMRRVGLPPSKTDSSPLVRS